MPDPIDELAQRWRQDPNAAATVALCEALREHPRESLVSQVGEQAAQRHAGDVRVLVSVARMYIESELFAEAQAVLVAAGKRAPRDARIFRWLGEVLLRRGDADRAEKVLERALQLGSQEPEARLWLERARVFRPMQATAGEVAVAAEVLQTTGGRLQSTNRPAPRWNVTSEPSVPGPWEEEEPSTVVPGKRRAATVSSLPPPPPAATASSFPPPPFAPRRSLPQHLPLPQGHSLPLPQPHSLPPKKIPSVPPRGHNGAQLPSWRPPEGSAVPYPRDVLDALALSGLFESGPSTAVRWDRANPAPKRKGKATLVTATVLFAGALVGTYSFYRQKRAAEHLTAEALLAHVETQLAASKPESIGEVEAQLGQALKLESRSPRAALDWARERAMVGLVKSGADVAFEDALTRAKDVGVRDEKVAFARVASFLLQGDTAGAVGVLPRWDGPAAGDAWYQLVAGATLERAGDPHARDRYAAAARLDSDLFLARVNQARALALVGDVDKSVAIAKELRSGFPDRAEPIALVALAWGRDPMRDALPTPPEVDEVSKRASELPSGLQFVPHAIAALRALDRHGPEDARAAVQKGLGVADSPGAAVWLGTVALVVGDEALARKAALSALQFSAVYEPARALAARVALHTGRLDEALKATEDLNPSSPDVVVVRAAAAYERLDPDGVALALQALRAPNRKLPFLTGVSLALDAFSGKLPPDGAKRLATDDDAPWSDLISMDVALDSGDLQAASRLSAAWGKEAESKPLRSIRLARLARYEGRLEAADALSEVALDHATVTPRVLWERVFELAARGRSSEVGPLLARYPLVLGPQSTWLSAYASASSGNADAARAKLAAINPPPAGATFEARVVAAAALAAAKDRKRGADLTRELLATGSLHPDSVASALSLGFHKVEHYRRKPTYE